MRNAIFVISSIYGRADICFAGDDDSSYLNDGGDDDDDTDDDDGEDDVGANAGYVHTTHHRPKVGFINEKILVLRPF